MASPTGNEGVPATASESIENNESADDQQEPIKDPVDDKRLEDLEMYRLDYESNGKVEEDGLVALAAGGEVLRPGDHVYMWCTLYQHHGIVLETRRKTAATVETTSKENEENEVDNLGEESCSVGDGNVCLLIAEFTNAALLDAPNAFGITSTVSNAASAGVEGGFRIVVEPLPHKWHKVKYDANPLECLTWRPGTCSSAQPTRDSSVRLLRVQFLKECRHLSPDYHILASNCETVAVWCVTGEWMTLQGDRALQLSQVGGALTGLVTLGLGVAAGGLAVWHSQHIGAKWKASAELLHREFEWYSLGKTPEFSFQPS